MQKILFALDCGATNWRIYRATYAVSRQSIRLVGGPMMSPLSSFVEGRLGAALLLNEAGTGLAGFGDAVYQSIYKEYIRDFFKPAIGSHLERGSLPYQVRYTHEEAIYYTGLLLEAVLEQLRTEKWRSAAFEENIHFALAYPLRWREAHQGKILAEFQELVAQCFPEQFNLSEQLSFVSEPEATLLGLNYKQLLPHSEGITLIIDAGGGTTELTAGQLNLRENKLEAIRYYGEPHGGGLYDETLAAYIAEQLKLPTHILENDPIIMHQLRMFGRQLKEDLSRKVLQQPDASHLTQRPITLVLPDGQVYRKIVKLDQAIFKRVSRYRIADFESLVENGLRQLHLQESDICQVVLVGGGGQLFTVRQHLEKQFGPDKVVLPDKPEETVVYGLALEYGKSFILNKLWLGKELDAEHTLAFLKGKDIKKESPDQTVEEVVPQLVEPEPPEPEEIPAVEGEYAGQWRIKSLVNGNVYPLADQPISIGRHRSNTIALYDGQISRHHAQIKPRTDGKYEVIDLDSRNGTFVNGEQLSPHTPHILQANDKIKFVRIEFVCLK